MCNSPTSFGRASLGGMGKVRQRSHEVPDVEPDEVRPLDVDGVRTVAILTILWALGFLVLAFRMSYLQETGRDWWLWTCLAGVGLGLLGLEYTRKRRDAIEAARQEAAQSAHQAARDNAGARAAGPGVAAPGGSPGEHDRNRVGTGHPNERGTDPVRPAPSTRPPGMPPPLQEQSSPNAVTGPIDTGVNPPLAALGPPVTQQPTSIARPAARSASGRPDWTSDRTDAGSVVPPAARREPAPRRQPVARPEPATRTQPAPAAEPRPTPAVSAERRGRRTKGNRRAASPPPSELFGDLPAATSAERTPPPAKPSTSPVSPAPPSPPAPSLADDEPLLDTTLSGRRARQPDIVEELDEITGSGEGRKYQGRRARRTDSA